MNEERGIIFRGADGHVVHGPLHTRLRAGLAVWWAQETVVRFEIANEQTGWTILGGLAMVIVATVIIVALYFHTAKFTAGNYCEHIVIVANGNVMTSVGTTWVKCDALIQLEQLDADRAAAVKAQAWDYAQAEAQHKAAAEKK